MNDNDEWYVLAVSLVGWGMIARQAWLIRPYRHSWAPRFPLIMALVMSAVLLGFVLNRCSSYDVRESYSYRFFYMGLGAGWLTLGYFLLGCVDLCIRDDVLERGNLASGFACGGAVLGLMICFAGGNVGNGHGWWLVVYSAMLAGSGLLLVWIILDKSTRLADTISIDRDLAGGIRAGGFWLGSGCILGQAVAGDWHSVSATNHDFIHYGWPVLFVLMAAIGVEVLTRPGGAWARSPLLIKGIAPASAYIITGFFCVIIFWKS